MQPTVRTPLLNCEYFIKVKGLYGSMLGCKFSSPEAFFPFKLGIVGKGRRIEGTTNEDEFDKQTAKSRRKSKSTFELLSTERHLNTRV